MTAVLEEITHPLEPANAKELAQAVDIVQSEAGLSKRSFFSFGVRVEPDKEDVLAHAPDKPISRNIQIVGHDRDKGQSFEAIVSLDDKQLAEFRWIDNGQAPLNGEDVQEVFIALSEHPDWLAALAKRGITDLSTVHIEPWLAGVRPPEMPEGRVMRALAFLHTHPDDNHYARPVAGLVALIDADSGKVIVQDHGVLPIPDAPADYAAQFIETMREDLKPLDITQPDGPSFEVEGHVIKWQKWHIRISVHPIEGLILHDVRYNDDGKDRSILYRASLSEMVVPYGDADPIQFWKHAFDAGETALGQQANSLKLGCDCLGEIYYFDASMLGPDGTPYTVENAVCLHEEDFGILWKHTNVFRPDLPPEVRRSRRLVVSMIHTIGNYEYGFFWYFYQDGNIQLEVKLTGIIGVSVPEDGEGSTTSPLVAPGITSPIHQHLFCFRLDFNLDGPENTVVESNVQPIANDPHPYGAGFEATRTVLATESEAQRKIDPMRSRNWRIENPNVKNGLGNPVAYKLLPQSSPTMLPGADTVSGKRGGFARNNLWVTPYEKSEHYAGAGPFTNLHSGGVGLSEYASQNRSVENKDVVVWHTFGVTHVPRPEDWPIMPVEYAGFMLMPYGFFDRNPSLDVPPSAKCGK
ncbi:MAG: primary-amine oxidase [Pseudomonadota bacterium]